MNEQPFDQVDGHEPQTTVAEPVGAPQPAAAFRRRRRMRIAAMTCAAVVIFGAGAGGGALAVTAFQSSGPSTTAIGGSQALGGGSGSTGSGSTGSGSTGGQGFSGGFGGFSGGQGFSGGSTGGQGSSGGFGGGFSGGQGSSGGSSSGSSTSTGTAATTAQTAGVVTIVSTLKYEDGEAAGTGIVLTSSGTILTNNHVVEGSTSIEVTDELTGKTYTATVVGTDATHDVAVLKLQNASGLTTAKLASTAAKRGDTVTAVGNAGGTGSLTQATGTVTALGQKITTQAEGADDSEHLTGLIQTDADIVSGDSGGPLTNSAGEVVGIDTAASSSTGSSDTTGFAIPIARALTIAQKILAGDASADIVIGYPAFLGVEIDTTATNTSGAVIKQVIAGTGAATAGLVAGDTVTAVDGTSVASNTALHDLIAAHSPGETVRVAYTDAQGASHTVTVTLTQGPAA